jgi:hypothetical protein
MVGRIILLREWAARNKKPASGFAEAGSKRSIVLNLDHSKPPRVRLVVIIVMVVSMMDCGRALRPLWKSVVMACKSHIGIFQSIKGSPANMTPTGKRSLKALEGKDQPSFSHIRSFGA